MSVAYSKHILLTGAGFTKNFGGFLADEMWARIFNNPDVQKSDNLRGILLNDFDYESIYQRVVFGYGIEQWVRDYSLEEKEAIKKATFNAYKELDDRILSSPLELVGDVNFFLSKFSRRTPEKKSCQLFFTLNQDLFIERDMTTSYVCPGLGTGIIQKPHYGSPLKRGSEYISREFDIILPENVNDVNLDPTNGVINYIKLHGSFNWKSASGNDALVIGVEKGEQIEGEPLLKEYARIFSEALSQAGTKLFVIGYGFGDRHINKVIADAVLNFNLKLHVLSPVKPKDFKTKLESVLGHNIYKGLSGYHHGEIKDIDFEKIGRDFFN